MTSRELVLATLEGKPVERTPWVPFVGCHGGSLIGTTASDYLTDARNMVEGAREAVKRYNPDGLPVMFDLQVEAEALGCALRWANENPPAVVSHPLEDGTLTLDDLEQ